MYLVDSVEVKTNPDVIYIFTTAVPHIVVFARVLVRVIRVDAFFVYDIIRVFSLVAAYRCCVYPVRRQL
jgi:hypothetical protein